MIKCRFLDVPLLTHLCASLPCRAGQRNHHGSPRSAGAQEHLGLPVQQRALHRGPHRRVVDRARRRHVDAAALPAPPAQGNQAEDTTEQKKRFN